jgi:hypothetical protein
MEKTFKNIKIGNLHHDMLKKYCEKNGLKIHKLIEKLIEAHCPVKKTDIYDED